MVKASVNTVAVQRNLREIIARCGDLSPVMQLMGRRMMSSTRKTFDVGGRPVPWVPPATFAVLPKGTRRKNARVQGRARAGGLLVKTGDLRRSVGFNAERHDLVLWDRPSMNVVKAPVHQWGTDRAGRGHNVDIPARPYLVFQREDIDYFKKLLAGFIRIGRAAAQSEVA